MIEIRRIVLCALVATAIAFPMAAQWPVLRTSGPYTIAGPAQVLSLTFTAPEYAFLLVFVGDTDSVPDARVYYWTTSSASPNADAPSPWDQIGESPAYGYQVARIPYKDAAGRVWPGWVVVPIKLTALLSGGVWTPDEHMRVIVYLSSPGCAASACGAATLLPRTDLSDIPMVGPAEKRRSAR